MLRYVLVLFVSIAFAYVITPLMIQIAKKFNIYDVPRERRVHKTPIPLLGGVSIAVSFLAASLIFGLFDKSTIGLIAGGLLILVIGVIDDIVELKPSYKLLGQILAGVVLVLSGIKIEFVTNFLTRKLFPLGIWSNVVTILWVVAFTNVVNFIDGLDGLASGVVAIASITIAFVAYSKGHTTISLLLFALAGSCIGFLKYNFNPAKIFMGDAGAMFLGYMLAAISALGAYKGPITLAVSIPIFVLVIPIIDTAFAIFRRLKKRKSISLGDKEHLHHRLLAVGLNQKQAVIAIYVGSAMFGIAAIYADAVSGISSVIIVSTMIVAMIVVGFKIGLFGSKGDKDV